MRMNDQWVLEVLLFSILPPPSIYFAENKDVLHVLDEAEDSMPMVFPVVNFLTIFQMEAKLIKNY